MLNPENCSGYYAEGIFIADKIQIHNDSANADIIIKKLNKLCKNKTEFNLKELLQIQDLISELGLYYIIQNNKRLIEEYIYKKDYNNIIYEIKHIINCEKELISIIRYKDYKPPSLPRYKMQLRFKHLIIINTLLYFIYFFTSELKIQFNAPFNATINLSYILYIILLLLVYFRPYEYYPVINLEAFTKEFLNLDEDFLDIAKLQFNNKLNFILYNRRYMNDKYISNKIKIIKYNLLSNDKDLIIASLNDLVNSLASLASLA
jgi:hypothetical protein